MTIVLPITTDTAHLAIQSIKWAALQLGGRFDAKLLVVPHASVDASAVVEAIGPLFQGVHVLPTHQVSLDNVFSEVRGWFHRVESKDTWFFWCPDYTLLRPDFRELMPELAIKPGRPFQPTTLKEFLVKLPVMQTTERTTFETLEQVHAEVDFQFFLHKGCTDGSLIQRLSEERNSTTVNVPQHVNPMTYYEPKSEIPPGSVDILYVTFAKDFPWLEYSLRSVKKFAVGFRRVIVAVPECDASQLEEVFDKAGVDTEDEQFPDGFHIYPYVDAPPGKGFVMHAAKICQADLISDASFFCHLDADCMMFENNDAGHYFQDGKPVLVWKSYDALKGPKLSGVVSDCHQWGAVSEQTLGMKIHAYTMLRHPHVYPREIYKPFRDRVEEVQGVPFEQWCLAQKNSHPQSIAEHPSLGGFCYERFRDKFHWVNAEEQAPRDLMKAFWSHESPDQWIGPGWHDGKSIVLNAEKRQTARMLIESWLT